MMSIHKIKKNNRIIKRYKVRVSVLGKCRVIRCHHNTMIGAVGTLYLDETPIKKKED